MEAAHNADEFTATAGISGLRWADIIASWRGILMAVALVLLLRSGWLMLEKLWWKPMGIVRKMQSQGIRVLPYRLLGGDFVQMAMLTRKAQSQPMPSVTHDIVPRIMPFLKPWLDSQGNSFIYWQGTAAPTLNIADPEMVKEILSTKSSCFHRGAIETRVLENFLGKSIFTIEGEAWAYHRRILTSSFVIEKLKVMLKAMSTNAMEMMRRWEALEDVNSSFELDVSQEFCDLAMDIFGHAIFGDSSYEQAKKFGKLQRELKEIKMSPNHALLAILFPSYGLLPIHSNRRAHRIRQNMNEIVIKMIEERIERAKSADIHKYGGDLLGSLLSESEFGNQEAKDIKKLRTSDVISEFHTIYFAGNDTTANLIAWTVMLLSLHPEWQVRARKEVEEVCKNSLIKDDKLHALKLLTTILQEALRLYPAVSELTRMCIKDTNIGGLNIPKGLQVWVPILQFHRNPEQWGDDSLQFRPDRFAQGATKACKHPLSYIPFSCGPRTCVGQAFAMMEAKVVLATILKHYSFQLSPLYKHGPIVGGAVYPQYGMPIIFHNIKSFSS